MIVADVLMSLGLTALTNKGETRKVGGGYTSDLLSDVMGNALEDQVLITIQAHKNTVAVASLIGSPLIIICNKREVPQDMIMAAEEESISIAVSEASQFEVSGRLHRYLVP